MKHQEPYIELIDAYLCGRLSEEARSSLEAKILSDPALAEQVEAQRLQLQGLELLLEDDLREKMTHWDDLKQQSKRRKIVWGTIISLTVVGLGFFWMTKNFKHKTAPTTKEQSPSMQSIPQDSSPLPPLDSNTRQIQTPKRNNKLKTKSEPIALLEFKQGIQDNLIDLYEIQQRGSDRDSLAQTMLVLLKSNDLNSAQQLLLQEARNAPPDFISSFSHATLDLLLGRYAGAVQAFEGLLQKEPSVLTDRVEWYLALAYLANAQNKQAETLLRKIAGDKGNDFQGLAQRLLERH